MNTLSVSLPILMIVLLLRLPVANAHFSQQADQGHRDTSKLRQILHQIAKDKLSRPDVILLPSVRDSVDKLIDVGVDKLSANHPSPDSVSSAKKNLIQFIDNLISNGETLRDDKKRISTQTFKKSKSGLCPLWPFC